MIFSTRKWLYLLAAPAIFQGAAGADTIRYLSGETAEGRVAFTAQGLLLTSKENKAAPLDLSAVLQVALRNSQVAPGTLAPGVVLADGTALADHNLPALDGPTADLGAEHFPVPTAAIARIVFVPSSLDKIQSPPGGQPGGWMLNGDFFAGTFLSCKGNRVSLNSTLFGPQTFNGKAQLTAVALRDLKPVAPRFIVTTIHGSALLTDEWQTEAGGIVLKEALLGSIKLKSEAVAEIHSGSGRLRWLADLNPERIVPPSGLDVATALRTQKSSAPEDAAFTPPRLTSAANAAITWSVPAGFTVFTAAIGLASDAPANARVSFAIYADGRLLHHSPLTGPADKPAPLRIDLKTARTLTLRAESTGLNTGVFGEWTGAMLLR